MRRLIAFPCAGDTLLGTLDDAAGATGLLIVSGGNEIRAGAHRGMAMLAARLAAQGMPVFRFDRRGVGDSSGENRGFAESGEDIAAAARAFRAAAPHVSTLVGFGNCDAATALALFHHEAGIDRLMLANPWVVDPGADDLPPAAAIRARYAARLADPGQWWRLLRGGVDIRKLVMGLAKMVASSNRQPDGLAERVAGAIRESDATVLLAQGDATAIAYLDATKSLGANGDVHVLDTESHSFARETDQHWLFARVIEGMRRIDQETRR